MTLNFKPLKTGHVSAVGMRPKSAEKPVLRPKSAEKLVLRRPSEKENVRPIAGSSTELSRKRISDEKSESDEPISSAKRQKTEKTEKTEKVRYCLYHVTV